jgi:hypothetical protein
MYFGPLMVFSRQSLVLPPDQAPFPEPRMSRFSGLSPPYCFKGYVSTIAEKLFQRKNILNFDETGFLIGYLNR